jgi:transposase
VSLFALSPTGFRYRDVYWIPLYEILDARGLEVYLVNARHTKMSRTQKVTCKKANGC